MRSTSGREARPSRGSNPFTGQQHDDDLGLIDYGGRVYDPLAAQFTTADPVTQAPLWSQGLNRYAYAFNDPVNNVDPSGFDAEESRLEFNIGMSAWGAGVVGGALISGHIASGSWGRAAGTAGNLATTAYDIYKSATSEFATGRSEATYRGAVPSAAPTGNGGGAGTASAVAQNRGAVGPASPSNRPSLFNPVPEPPGLHDMSNWLAGPGAGGPDTPYLPDEGRKPPGWNSDWPEGVDARGPYSQDPEGTKWYPHPEDAGHWDHYDNSKGRAYPENNVKPWPNQKRPPYGNQSPTDPWPAPPPPTTVRYSAPRSIPPAAVGTAVGLTGAGIGLIILMIVFSPVGV